MAKIAFIEITATVFYGGIQTAVWELADELTRRGHDVTVIGGEGSIDNRRSGEATRRVTFPFIDRERFPNFGRRFRRLCERLSLARHARQFVADGQFDWVIVTKPFDFFWPHLINKRCKTRFLFLSGGTDFFAGDRLLAKRIDAWASVSHFNAWQLRVRYEVGASVVFNGVDVEQFSPRQETLDLHSRYGLSGDAVIFGFAGRLVGWKGIAVAINAMAHPLLRDMNVALVLVGDGAQRAELETLVARNGLDKRVFFHGPVRHAEIPRLYSSLHVGVFPSVGDEAFGITVAEAMSCARPVIGSYIGGIPEVIGNENSCGYLTAPGNVEALAQAMRSLAEDPQRRAAMGRAARSRIEQNFTWSAAAQRLMNLMQV